MKVGDRVQITRRSANEFGMYGTISRPRITGEWFVQLDDGPEWSWRESSMILDDEYAAAVKLLGEEYFA